MNKIVAMAIIAVALAAKKKTENNLADKKL